jgi:hypothetical protein
LQRRAHCIGHVVHRPECQLPSKSSRGSGGRRRNVPAPDSCIATKYVHGLRKRHVKEAPNCACLLPIASRSATAAKRNREAWQRLRKPPHAAPTILPPAYARPQARTRNMLQLSPHPAWAKSERFLRRFGGSRPRTIFAWLFPQPSLPHPHQHSAKRDRTGRASHGPCTPPSLSSLSSNCSHIVHVLELADHDVGVALDHSCVSVPLFLFVESRCENSAARCFLWNFFRRAIGVASAHRPSRVCSQRIGTLPMNMTQNHATQRCVALALLMTGGWLMGGANIYGALCLPRDEIFLVVWPIWAVALAPISAGIVMLRRLNKAKAK